MSREAFAISRFFEEERAPQGVGKSYHDQLLRSPYKTPNIPPSEGKMSGGSLANGRPVGPYEPEAADAGGSLTPNF